MARRRFGRRGSFRGRSFKRSRGHSTGISLTNVLLAGALYGVARPLIANALPNMFSIGPVDSDNAILGVGGYFLSKKSSGLMKALGIFAMGTEAGIVTGKLISGTSTTQSTTNFGLAPYNSGYSY